MRIAFDLDDTLIPTQQHVPREQGMVFALVGVFFRERLRQGTCHLLRQLNREGHDVWIYTTSLRSPLRIAWWFRCLGVRLGGVINHTRHTQVVSAYADSRRYVSKYPPAFGIDWLVDDSIGVKEEGLQYGFSVIHVRPEDRHWVTTIRQALTSTGGSV
jgi:hypothetical protein